MSKIDFNVWDGLTTPRFKKIILCIHTNIKNKEDPGSVLETYWGVGVDQNNLMLLIGQENTSTWEELVNKVRKFHYHYTEDHGWFNDPFLTDVPPIEILINDHCEELGFAKSLDDSHINSNIFFTKNENFKTWGKHTNFWILSSLLKESTNDFLTQCIYIGGTIVSKHLLELKNDKTKY